MGAGAEIAKGALIAKTNLDGLATAAGLSTAIGGAFLALGRRRKPTGNESSTTPTRRTIFRRGQR